MAPASSSSSMTARGTPWENDKIDPDLYKRFIGLTKFGVEAYLCEITYKRHNIDLAKTQARIRS